MANLCLVGTKGNLPFLSHSDMYSSTSSATDTSVFGLGRTSAFLAELLALDFLKVLCDFSVASFCLQPDERFDLFSGLNQELNLYKQRYCSHRNSNKNYLMLVLLNCSQLLLYFGLLFLVSFLQVEGKAIFVFDVRLPKLLKSMILGFVSLNNKFLDVDFPNFLLLDKVSVSFGVFAFIIHGE